MHAPSTLTRRPFRPLHLPVARVAAAASAIFLLAAPTYLHAQQTLYVANDSQNVIDRVDSAGTVSTFAALPANTQPAGIAFDQGGNLYVADQVGSRILQINPAGAVNPTPYATLPANQGLTGLAFDRSGNLYAANAINNQVSRISPAGAVSVFATLPAPNGLAFDAAGNLYAADFTTSQISRISSSGTVSLFATLPTNSRPDGLAFDASGNLYAATDSTSQIFSINPAGLVSLFATLPANSGPVGLAFDRLGNLYAADSNTSQLSRISADGQNVSSFAGIFSPGYLAFGVVPEPSTWALAALGGLVIVVARGWRGRQAMGRVPRV